MEVLGDLFDGELLVSMGYDGTDGLGAGLERRGPLQGVGGAFAHIYLNVDVHLCLRLDRLGGLIFGAEVADVSLLLFGLTFGVEVHEALQNGPDVGERIFPFSAV